MRLCVLAALAVCSIGPSAELWAERAADQLAAEIVELERQLSELSASNARLDDEVAALTATRAAPKRELEFATYSATYKEDSTEDSTEGSACTVAELLQTAVSEGVYLAHSSGEVVGTASATVALPLAAAPIFLSELENINYIKQVQVSYTDPVTLRRVGVGLQITSTKLYNRTAVSFTVGMPGRELRIWNGEAYLWDEVAMQGGELVYGRVLPVCYMNADCSSFSVPLPSSTAAQDLLDQANAVLEERGFKPLRASAAPLDAEGRRRLGDSRSSCETYVAAGDDAPFCNAAGGEYTLRTGLSSGSSGKWGDTSQLAEHRVDCGSYADSGPAISQSLLTGFRLVQPAAAGSGNQAKNEYELCCLAFNTDSTQQVGSTGSVERVVERKSANMGKKGLKIYDLDAKVGCSRQAGMGVMRPPLGSQCGTPVPIKSCQASSKASTAHGCENVYDGLVGTCDAGAKAVPTWSVSSSASAVGSWIFLEFETRQTINTMRYANIRSAGSANKQLQLEFSDGSTEVIILDDVCEEKIDDTYTLLGDGSCTSEYISACKPASNDECAAYCSETSGCGSYTWTATADASNDCGAGAGQPACWLHSGPDSTPLGSDTFRQCYTAASLCPTWTYREGYYSTIEHGAADACQWGVADSLHEIKEKCVADDACTAVVKQSNQCSGKYRIVHGGPSLVYYDDWLAYDLWAYELVDRSGPCASLKDDFDYKYTFTPKSTDWVKITVQSTYGSSGGNGADEIEFSYGCGSLAVKTVATMAGDLADNSKTLLSVGSAGTPVDLWSTDDGSGRQRWTFVPVEGSDDPDLFTIQMDHGTTPSKKFLSAAEPAASCTLQLNENDVGGSCNTGGTLKYTVALGDTLEVPSLGAFNDKTTSIKMTRSDGNTYCQVKLFKNNDYGDCYCDIGMDEVSLVGLSRRFEDPDLQDVISSFTLSYNGGQADSKGMSQCSQCDYSEPNCHDCSCDSSKWCECSDVDDRSTIELVAADDGSGRQHWKVVPLPAQDGVHIISYGDELDICWSGKMANTYIAGYVGGGSTPEIYNNNFNTAKAACESSTECVGLTYEPSSSYGYTGRTGDIGTSPSSEYSYLKDTNGCRHARYLSASSDNSLRTDSYDDGTGRQRWQLDSPAVITAVPQLLQGFQLSVGDDSSSYSSYCADIVPKTWAGVNLICTTHYSSWAVLQETEHSYVGPDAMANGNADVKCPNNPSVVTYLADFQLEKRQINLDDTTDEASDYVKYETMYYVRYKFTCCGVSTQGVVQTDSGVSTIRLTGSWKFLGWFQQFSTSTSTSKENSQTTKSTSTDSLAWGTSTSVSVAIGQPKYEGAGAINSENGAAMTGQGGKFGASAAFNTQRSSSSAFSQSTTQTSRMDSSMSITYGYGKGGSSDDKAKRLYESSQPLWLWEQNWGAGSVSTGMTYIVSSPTMPCCLPGYAVDPTPEGQARGDCIPVNGTVLNLCTDPAAVADLDPVNTTVVSESSFPDTYSGGYQGCKTKLSRQTPPTYKTTWFLPDLEVGGDCPLNAPLVSFALAETETPEDTDDETDGRYYNYECCDWGPMDLKDFPDSDGCYEDETEWQDTGGSWDSHAYENAPETRYLNRQSVECKANHVLMSFQLDANPDADPADSSSTKWRYKYRCCPTAKHDALACTAHYSADEGFAEPIRGDDDEYNANDFTGLTQLSGAIDCKDNGVLQSFMMENLDPDFMYKYTCCKVLSCAEGQSGYVWRSIGKYNMLPSTAMTTDKTMLGCCSIAAKGFNPFVTWGRATKADATFASDNRNCDNIVGTNAANCATVALPAMTLGPGYAGKNDYTDSTCRDDCWSGTWDNSAYEGSNVQPQFIKNAAFYGVVDGYCFCAKDVEDAKRYGECDEAAGGSCVEVFGYTTDDASYFPATWGEWMPLGYTNAQSMAISLTVGVQNTDTQTSEESMTSAVQRGFSGNANEGMSGLGISASYTMSSTTTTTLSQSTKDIVSSKSTYTTTISVEQSPEFLQSMIWRWVHFLDGPCSSAVVQTPWIAMTFSEAAPPCCLPNPNLKDPLTGSYSYNYRDGCPPEDVFRDENGVAVVEGCALFFPPVDPAQTKPIFDAPSL